MSDKLSMYDPVTERYTDAAHAFSGEIHDAIASIFDKYIAEGYKIREMQNLANSEVDIIALVRLI